MMGSSNPPAYPVRTFECVHAAIILLEALIKIVVQHHVDPVPYTGTRSMSSENCEGLDSSVDNVPSDAGIVGRLMRVRVLMGGKLSMGGLEGERWFL